MGNNVTFDEMNELLDEIYRSGGETWVEIDGQTYYTDWGYGAVAIEFFIRMLKNRKSDNDATLVRHSVAEDADEIIEHIINANMMSMPYDVYSELFDAVDGLGVEIENLQSENTKLRNELEDQEGYDQMLRDRLRQQTELCVKAEDENKRLCNERECLFQANVEKNGEILRLLEENAKLRELCVGFWQALKGDTQDCPLVICEYMYECSDDECVYERMMQELGIEVDW